MPLVYQRATAKLPGNASHPLQNNDLDANSTMTRSVGTKVSLCHLKCRRNVVRAIFALCRQ